jgi:two-component system sensor histidine kinase DegS
MNRDELVETSPREELVGLIREEMTRIKRRLGEIKDQISSMQSSVDKEQSRYSSIATELRNIKDNLDTVPRTDIRDKYDEALDIRFRLATMRGQLEKFEANYDYLEREQEILSNVMSQLQGVEMIEGGDSAGGKSSGVLDVVGIIRAQEEERERLARAMHDGPAQSLTNFILQAEICQRLFDRDPDRAAEELNNLKTNASKTFQKVRDFIFDLRPMMLGDLGVLPTVRRYVESYREKTDIAVDLDISGEERRLEQYREVMIFRAVQDVMGMARDYADPGEILMSVMLNPEIIRVTIEDDGRGFDSEGMFERAEEEGHTDARVQALNMLKNQFELVGGTVSVRSDESDGTVVRLELPTG